MWSGGRDNAFAQPPPPAGGFSPQPGFSLSGTLAFDSTIVLTNSSNPFGSVGPLEVIFDNFNTGTPGAAMANNTPGVSGAYNWLTDPRGSSQPPWIFGPANSNPEGTGPCVRILNNERAGAVNGFGRGMYIPFGAHYFQFYTSYRERWNGWNGRQLEGGGGGYYKMGWIASTADFGNTGFDSVVPVFQERSSVMGVAGAVWSPASGGILTITSTSTLGGNGSNIPVPNGTTFTAVLGVDPNYANSVAWAPSGINGSYAGATIIATNKFTIPMPADPGTMTPGTVNDFGAYNTNAPSLGSNLEIGGNSAGKNGCPANFDIRGIGPGSPNGTGNVFTTAGYNQDAWDYTGWNTHQIMWLGDPTSPSSNSGKFGSQLFNAVNKRAWSNFQTTVPAFGTAGTLWGYFDRWYTIGLMQTIGTHTVDRGTYRCAIGDGVTSLAARRLAIGDTNNPATCTLMEDCSDHNWSAGQIVAKIRPGRLTTLHGMYLYWWDELNNPTVTGQFN